MNELKIILVILGILYLIERKSINTLMNFVGIVIILAILLGLQIPSGFEGLEFISYILILVQISALTILFGFIIMLFAQNTTNIIQNLNNPIQTSKKNYSIFSENRNKKIILILILSILGISSIIIIYLSNTECFIQNQIYNIIKNIEFVYNNATQSGVLERNSINLEIHKNTTVEKIGMKLFSEESNIIKFIIITLILLLAIIALFYMILPTI